MKKNRRTVEVLLLEDDEFLGEVGDVVQVRPGHARNYLLPTGRACPVTKDALRRIERARQEASRRRAERAERMAALSQRLDGLRLTIEEKASEEGHLFGSVSASTIVSALAAQGIEVEEKRIGLEQPLKELGIFQVPVRLEGDVEASVSVWVVEPGE